MWNGLLIPIWVLNRFPCYLLRYQFKPSGNYMYQLLLRAILVEGESAAARLLGLGVRIPQRARMSVCCECCEVEVCATGRSLVQRSPTECDVEISMMRSSTLSRAVEP